MRAANIRIESYRVFVKAEGKKSGVSKASGIKDAKDAVKKAMELYDRTNTVYVKQAWYNPKSCYTGDVKVFEAHDGNLWFEDEFSAKLKQ